MAPHSRIYLTRHAQAEHNVDLDYSIPDAPLTPLGKKQAAALAPKISSLQDSAHLIVTSPLKRTLQTTKLGCGPAVERLGIKNVICLPQAQECNAFPCDTGSAKAELAKHPEFKEFDLALLTDDWTSKQGFYSEDRGAIADRAKWVRHFLRDRAEENIVLVAHGDVLRQITASSKGPSEHMWQNAEVRIFEFNPEHVDGEAFLHQKEDVAAAGGYGPTSSSTDFDA
nr:hypothetical protein B0A51_05663 [Rachicladosporium sp. CCFEE 5018]